jgi:hypothetical protein
MPMARLELNIQATCNNRKFYYINFGYLNFERDLMKQVLKSLLVFCAFYTSFALAGSLLM